MVKPALKAAPPGQLIAVQAIIPLKESISG